MILGFCYSNFTQETGGFVLALTITLALRVNRLTKCASHPKVQLKQLKAATVLVLLMLKLTLEISEEALDTASELSTLSSPVETGSWLINLLSPLRTLFSV